MAYPKKVPGEYADEESMTTAPKAPGVPRMVPEQVQGVRGGAPHLNQDSAVRATASLRKAWEMTGVPKDAFDRTYQRTQTGVDPGVVAQSLRRFWSEGQNAASGRPMLSAPTLPLQEAQDYLKDLASNIRSALDEQAKQLGEQGVATSRFWSAYQRYPEAMSALVARRIWSGQMLGGGPVARWLEWLGR